MFEKLAPVILIFPALVAAQSTRIVSVVTFGADPTGAADSTAATQKTIDAVARVGGGTVTFPPGNYKTSATLTRPANVLIQGAGPELSSITSTCNCAIIAATGTQANVVNNGGVRDITLNGTWGANHANIRSTGISESWTNRSIHQNVRIHGTYHGMYGQALWQVKWENVHVDGAGRQQSYIAFYLDQLPTTFPVGTSNAVEAVNCVAQGVLFAGFRLLNPNGSKFINDEAENGEFGWWIGTTSAGVYPIEFAHFANDLADTNSGYGWMVQQGLNSSPATYMQFVNIWASTSNGPGFYCDGCSSINISNGQFGNNGAGGVHLNNSKNVILANSELQANNTGAHPGVGDIWISGGNSNRVIGNHSNMANATSVSILESNGTNNNDFADNTANQGCKVTGAYSTVHNSRGCSSPNIEMKAGTSPWTSPPQNYDCLDVITKAGGLSALSTNGVSLQTSANAAFFIKAGKTFTATWTTTAPVFTCIPES